MIKLSTQEIIETNEDILMNAPGLKGTPDVGKLESALMRVDNHIMYAQMDDLFEIAALYGVAIAKAHAFPDGNKRTALVSVLTFLESSCVNTEEDDSIDDVMVKVAEGSMDVREFAEYLRGISYAVRRKD